jgi:hypothetical protein
MTWTARSRSVKVRGHLLAWPRCARDSEELQPNDQMGGEVGSISSPKDLEQVPPRYTSMTSDTGGGRYSTASPSRAASICVHR